MGYYLKNKDGSTSGLKIATLRGDYYSNADIYLSKYALRQVMALVGENLNSEYEQFEELLEYYDEMNRDYIAFERLGIVRIEEISGVFKYKEKLPFIIDVLLESNIEVGLYEDEMLLVDMKDKERIKNILNSIFNGKIYVDVDEIKLRPKIVCPDLRNILKYVENPTFQNSLHFNNAGMAVEIHDKLKCLPNNPSLERCLDFINTNDKSLNCIEYITGLGLNGINSSSRIIASNPAGKEVVYDCRLKYVLLGNNGKIYLSFQDKCYRITKKTFYYEFK